MILDIAPVLEELNERTRKRGTEMSVATMTIVVFFEDAAIGELARDRIHTLAAKHPSRVIVLDATQNDDLRRVEHGDWIELGVRGSDAETVRAAASALCLPEAPVVLLWVAPGIGDDARFRALCPESKTIVYNSSLVDAGSRGLCQLVDFVGKNPGVAISDIAYLRLGPWQESVAMLFDGEESAELAELLSVEIACGSEPEALYLMGWLASRLGWKARSTQEFFSAAGRQIAFALEREGEPRRIKRVALSSMRSRFVAETGADGESIHLSVTGSYQHPQRYRPVNNPGIAALVERAILRGQDDRVFRSALAAAGEFLACAERT